MMNVKALVRPIVGIENRTAQEVFDIMCDRITQPAPPTPVIESQRQADIAWARDKAELEHQQATSATRPLPELEAITRSQHGFEAKRWDRIATALAKAPPTPGIEGDEAGAAEGAIGPVERALWANADAPLAEFVVGDPGKHMQTLVPTAEWKAFYREASRRGVSISLMLRIAARQHLVWLKAYRSPCEAAEFARSSPHPEGGGDEARARGCLYYALADGDFVPMLDDDTEASILNAMLAFAKPAPEQIAENANCSKPSPAPESEGGEARARIREMWRKAEDLNVANALDLLAEYADDATLSALLAKPSPASEAEEK